MKLSGAISFCAVLLLAAPAGAGLGDKPPLLNGDTKAKHVYSMTGVLSETNGLSTVVTCTSLEKSKDLLFAVEFFGTFGAALNDVTTAGVVTIPPGETRSIGSLDTSMYTETYAAGLSRIFEVLSARVLATSSKLLCNAFLVEEDGTPTVGSRLPVYKKTKQAGD